ncbi:hypothetical protein [Methanimicrococcus hongohii]|nr:hypothetical protein [Methanimicrococcus sp. Hf6]
MFVSDWSQVSVSAANQVSVSAWSQVCICRRCRQPQQLPAAAREPHQF